MKRAGKVSKIFLGGWCSLLVLTFAYRAFSSVTPKFGYVVNRISSDISAYSIDSTTGSLSPVSGSPFTTEAHSVAIAISGESIVSVVLDVKLGGTENAINPKGNGVIPVAILSTNSFEASTVDQASLRFGPNQASVEGSGQFVDVNADGLPDLVLHFWTQDAGIRAVILLFRSRGKLRMAYRFRAVTQ